MAKNRAITSIGRTLTWVALISYVVTFLFEIWRQGFVTYFWNPQWLLVIALVGMLLGARGEPATVRSGRRLAFFVLLAIVGGLAVWQLFPPSGTRILATSATVILVGGLVPTSLSKTQS